MGAALMATGAQAQDHDAEFTAAALKCWNSPSVDGKFPKLIWKVEISDKGELIDITSETPKPDNGRAVIESLKRALQRCAPYKFPAGVYKVTVDKNTNGGKSLNPYK